MSIKTLTLVALSVSLLAACSKPPAEPAKPAATEAAPPAPAAAPADAAAAPAAKDNGGKGDGSVHPSSAMAQPPK